MKLTTDDVVRHRLVKAIIKAYDKSDQERQKLKKEREAEKAKAEKKL